MLNHKKNLVMLLITLMCLSAIMIAIPVEAKKADKINVYPGDSIQNAINNALPGSTIVVNAGTYDGELIVIDKPLTLTGKQATIQYTGTLSNQQNGLITVQVGGVEISGFTLIATCTGWTNPVLAHTLYPNQLIPIFDGIRVTNMVTSFSGCIIRNNVIISNTWGIGSNGGQSNIVIQGNEITATVPLFLTNTPNAIIKNNIIAASQLVADFGTYSDNRPVGIRLNTVPFSGCSIVGNTITSQTNAINPACFGILIGTDSAPAPTTGPSNVKIKGNQITAFTAIFAGFVQDITITDNQLNSVNRGIGINNLGNTPAKISGNTINSGATGIIIYEPSLAKITNNNIVAGFNGIVVDSVLTTTLKTETLISGNVIAGNFQHGIACGGAGSAFNTITGNTITGGSGNVVKSIDGKLVNTGDYAFWFLMGAHDNHAFSNTITGVDHLLDFDRPGPNNVIDDVIISP
jgi:hypothetical protein